MSTLEESLVSAPPPNSARYYRISALFCGFLRMWRAFVPMTLAVLANMVLQTILVIPYTPTAPTFVVVILGLLSWAFFIICFAVITAAGLLAATGSVSLNAAIAGASAHFWRFALWTSLYFLVVAIGFWFYTIPGLILGVALVFVPLAAMDGQRNPLAANFVTIGRRIWRFLSMAVIVWILLILLDLILIGNGFFITNFWVATIESLIVGVLWAWLLTSFGLVYKSAMADRS